ncbi:MAG: hypothetical protein ACLFUG_04195 [Nitriliruptoraceae bacterium]
MRRRYRADALPDRTDVQRPADVVDVLVGVVLLLWTRGAVTGRHPG